MSLDVPAMVASGDMYNQECILCGNCADTCGRKVMRFAWHRPNKNAWPAGGQASSLISATISYPIYPCFSYLFGIWAYCPPPARLFSAGPAPAGRQSNI